KFLAKKVDRYIAVSDYVKQEYIRQGFNENKISVVPNSLDLNHFASRTKISHEGFNILYVGRMSEEKGVNVLIRAFAIASKTTHKKIRLILVGDGPEISQYRDLVKEIGIEDKVTFTGHQGQNTIQYYYSIAD